MAAPRAGPTRWSIRSRAAAAQTPLQPILRGQTGRRNSRSTCVTSLRSARCAGRLCRSFEARLIEEWQFRTSTACSRSMSGEPYLARLGWVAARCFYLGGGSCGLTNLSVYAATKGAAETWSGICLHPRPARLRCAEPRRVPPPGNGRVLQTTGGRAGGGAPPARSPTMRFVTSYETRSRSVGGSHPKGRHLGARLPSSVAKTARPQDAALYSFGATFRGHCCERNSIPAR
jgi:hypothetical protein